MSIIYKSCAHRGCLYILAQEIVNGDLGVITHAMCLVDEHHFTGKDTEAQEYYMT